MLREVETPPLQLRAAIISRIKIMARLNIAERRLPQDGRIKLAVRGKDIDLRVATMPTMHGEAVVLRILDRGQRRARFHARSASKTPACRLSRGARSPKRHHPGHRPDGQRQDHHALPPLIELNTPDRKVLAVEDPIEYQLDGVNQVQIKPQIGLSFAHVLRSMLRHDPDVIMVGEIRDLETAQIAIQAALTGHLVLSTVHTNNAASTLTRLLDMGVEDYLMTSTLNAIVAQRLVRRLCQDCASRYTPLPELLAQLGREGHDAVTFWRPEGCPKCNDTGYFGRISINEVLRSCRTPSGARSCTTPRRPSCSAPRWPPACDRCSRTALARPRPASPSIEEVLRVTREVDWDGTLSLPGGDRDWRGRRRRNRGAKPGRGGRAAARSGAFAARGGAGRRQRCGLDPPRDGCASPCSAPNGCVAASSRS